MATPPTNSLGSSTCVAGDSRPDGPPAPTAIDAPQSPTPRAANQTDGQPPHGIRYALAVAQAFRAGVWTMVEVLDARLRIGHVYFEVSERSADGAVLAKANAIIW